MPMKRALVGYIARQAAKRAKTLTTTSRYRSGRYYKTRKSMIKWRSRKAIRRMIRSSRETKRVDFANNRQSIYHNGGSASNPLPNIWQINATSQLPAQGDGDGNRDGNDIYAVGWTLRMQFNIPSDRLNSKYRCVVFRVPRGTIITTNVTQILDPVTGNCMIDPIDKDRITVLKTFFVGPGKSMNPGIIANKEVTWYRKVFVPAKRVIKFYDDGSQENNQIYDIYMAVWGYDTWGTLVSEIVGYCQMWSRFTFKDK